MNRELSIYNTMKRGKELFKPLQPGKVGMYVCGVTVYDYSHVGHARVMVVFDLIYRWLTHLGYDVDYVRNFTDVDDKIIKRANERNISCSELTEEMIAVFHEDMDRLNCLRPTHEPKATEHMDEIIQMIESLVEKGYAYVSDSGDVLYVVRKFEPYGNLSGKILDDLESGSRVDVDQSKRDPLDFVLWKKAKPEEPSWSSPWGEGRPGWHIECSAMSCEHLGSTFDIHGGGMDLKFPHHENEIAQAEAANGGDFARYWIHNGFVNIDAEKMSKSLGNFFTMREVYERYDPEVLRMFILGTHYRSPLDYCDKALDAAKSSLDRLYKTKQRIGKWPEGVVDGEYVERFSSAMCDDFNTPEALAVVFDLCREVNRSLDCDDSASDSVVAELSSLCSQLGILNGDVDSWFKGDDSDVDWIEALIVERTESKKSRDFARADAIRDELAAKGIVLEDGLGGTIWKKM